MLPFFGAFEGFIFGKLGQELVRKGYLGEKNTVTIRYYDMLAGSKQEAYIDMIYMYTYMT